MKKLAILDNLVAENLGYLRTASVVDAGISKAYLVKYAKSRGLERVAHGLYMAPDAWKDAMYIIQVRYPQVIFSHETALFLHDLTDREPLHYSVTMQSRGHSTKLTSEGVKVYKIKEDLFEIGLSQSRSSFGHLLRTYDPERTICDIIRSRNNIEIQDFQTALKKYVRKKDRDIPLLMRYAKSFSVDAILGQYLEVLL